MAVKSVQLYGRKGRAGQWNIYLHGVRIGRIKMPGFKLTAYREPTKSVIAIGKPGDGTIVAVGCLYVRRDKAS